MSQRRTAKTAAPGMLIEDVAIDALAFDERDARKHGLRNLAAIVESLKRFGQQRPIVVDARNVVRAGNGTLEAAKQLGWPTIKIVRSDLDGAELAAFAIADNRTAELAEWDVAVLIEQLKEFEAHGGVDLLGAAGFNDGELAKLLASIDGTASDPVDEWEGMPEFEQPDAMPFRSIVVHFTEQAHVDDFATLIGQTISDRTKFVYHPRAERADNTQHRYAAVEPEAEVES